VDKKIIYSEDDGNLIYYYRESDENKITYCMTKEEWKIELLFDALVSTGANEKLLSDFRQAVYSNAYDEAKRDSEEKDGF